MEIAAEPGPEEGYFSRRFGDLLHIDDPSRLDAMNAVGKGLGHELTLGAKGALSVQLMAYQIDGRHEQAAGHEAFLERLERHPAILSELVELSGLLQPVAT